jgi:hypothetical protein
MRGIQGIDQELKKARYIEEFQFQFISKSNSINAQHVTLQIKMDDELSKKNAGLAQQNDFGPAFLLSLLKLAKDTTKPNTC